MYDNLDRVEKTTVFIYDFQRQELVHKETFDNDSKDKKDWSNKMKNVENAIKSVEDNFIKEKVDDNTKAA